MAEVKARSSLDTRGFNGGIDRMNNKVSGFGSRLKAVKGMIIAAFTASVITRFVRSAVQSFMQFETIHKQFEILFRDSQKATAHLKDLKEFSAKTPFQIEGIAEASKHLTVFTEGAMGGTESLRLIGDAAAATNQQIEDVGMWTGRAYAAIKAGRPFGEAAMRLQEMGILGAEARNKMEDLQKAGASNQEVWAVLTGEMQKFTGGMEELSQTTAGRLSTLKDNWNLALAEMGEALAPFINSVITGLTTVVQAFSSAVKFILRTSATMGNKFSGTGKTWAEAWAEAGEQIETQFGKVDKSAKGVQDNLKMAEQDAATKETPKTPKARGTSLEGDELARIGGSAGGVSSMAINLQKMQHQEQVKANRLLAKIADNTDDMGGLAA